MYMRCLRGRFPAEKFEAIAQLLEEMQANLTPAVRALPGLIDYYVGIDQTTAVTLSVSVWDRAEHAEAMERIAAGIDTRTAIEQAGVTWDPVDTIPVTFWVQPS
jgi:hypothetical protein